ncbi:hypothetical protein GH714_032207 [Hevea brasiliensis]|uniref:Uncharacterized protein n=1 Tax=Hevea brasiliensis TaxID=3981 RepID=A0A6A6N6K3_HEVBR|nr:hypothetical protein GH714_032207 [Hevea brasiliensis]
MDHHKDAIFLDKYALLRNKKQVQGSTTDQDFTSQSKHTPAMENMEKAMLGIKAALDAVTSSSNLLDLTSTVVDAASSYIII